MKPIAFYGTSALLCLLLFGCEAGTANQSPNETDSLLQSNRIKQGLDSADTDQPGNAILDSVIQTDSAAKTYHHQQPNVLKGSRSTNHPTEPRRFYVMYPRTFDSLMSTEGAVARLHPEDKALFERRSRSGKLRLPKLDPVTHKPLPFPYSYPDIYRADIRRLDSIKAADAPKTTPPQR